MSSIIAPAAPAAPAVEVEECVVCCEPYNKRSHAPVECEYAECKYKVCIGCVRTYLESSTNEAHCMECNKAWSKDFQVKSLKASWINGAYRQHRKQLLVDIEISKLPETMEAAARYKALKSEQALAIELRSEISVLKKKQEDTPQEERQKKYNEWLDIHYTPNIQNPLLTKQSKAVLEKDRIAEWHRIYTPIPTEQMNLVGYQLFLCRQRIHALNHPNAADADGASATAEGEKKEKRVFIMPCPANECKGMLSTQYKCGICEMFACSECHEMIGEDKSTEHTCDPNNVASAKAIKKETKQCPGCPNRIYRIEGCSQMWCTGCHTAFDWNTGRVVKSQQLHNPHWLDYQRNKSNGQGAMRAPGDVPCGGMIGYNETRTIITQIEHYLTKLLKNMVSSYTEEEMYNYVSACIVTRQLLQLYETFSQITRNSIRLIRAELQHEQNFETQRCKYIVNEMTKEQLSAFIYTKTAKREQKTHVLHIYELLSAVGIDTFNEIYNSKLRNNDFVLFVIDKMIELDALRVHCNGLFAQLSYTYNLATPFIQPITWFMVTQKRNQKELKEMLEIRPELDHTVARSKLVDYEWLTSGAGSSEKIHERIIKKRERIIQESLDNINDMENDMRSISESSTLGLNTREKKLQDAKEMLDHLIDFGNDQQVKEATSGVDEASKALDDMKSYIIWYMNLIQKEKDYSTKLIATTDTIKNRVWEGGPIVKSFNKEKIKK